uniref:Rhodanese domain-containing protein n=1 Tax=Timema genevievae TaxID=629358 RepID=A0A7R9K5A8_TIMGE|nr:unnamed protein product [Timema genevievae]
MVENVNQCSSRRNDNTKTIASQTPREQRTAGSLRIHGDQDFEKTTLCPVKQFESRRKIMSSSACKSQEVKLVSYEELNTLIHDKSAILIDVRERKELADTGVLPNSVNIPLGELEEALVNTPDDKFNEKYGITKPETSDKLVFSCRSGKRSLMATQKALAAGYCKYV